jgi:hypothetical protein
MQGHRDFGLAPVERIPAAVRLGRVPPPGSGGRAAAAEPGVGPWDAARVWEPEP